MHSAHIEPLPIPHEQELLQLGRTVWLERASQAAFDRYTSAVLDIRQRIKDHSDATDAQVHDALQGIVSAACIARAQWQRFRQAQAAMSQQPVAGY